MWNHLRTNAIDEIKLQEECRYIDGLSNPRKKGDEYGDHEIIGRKMENINAYFALKYPGIY